MGLIRLIMQYFMNNERLINKLADSKPIRKSAKFIVYILMRRGMMNSSYKLKSPSEAIQILKNIASNFKKEIKQIKEEMKKK